MLAGQQAPNPPQFPKAGLLWWLLAQKARFTNMKCSKRPLHPQHSFFYLLSWVGEYRLCLRVSFCQERKAGLASRKPDCPYSSFHVTQEMKEKVKVALSLGGMALCPAARYRRASRGKTSFAQDGSRSPGGERGMRFTEENEKQRLG